MNQYNENNKREGYWEENYTDYNMICKGNYINGKEEGYWKFHLINNDLHCRIADYFNNVEIVSCESSTKIDAVYKSIIMFIKRTNKTNPNE